jgi:CIC family chloride channel protein
LWRVLFHSLLVGAMAGGVACVFLYALEAAQWLLLGKLAHLHVPRPGAEVHLMPEVSDAPTRWWVVAIVPALGGLMCGLLTHRFAPEAAGAGGDRYIEAFHQRRGRVRPRVPLVAALGALFTIGSGGSAGREGPTVQVSAGLGSMLAGWLRLGERERRLLLVAGAAAGTGAMFRTPLGGALFAIEVLYREDFESDAIIPCVLASVTGYSIVTVVFGPGHVFTTDPHYAFVPAALPLFVVMGLGLSLFGVVFAKVRHGLQDRFFEPLGLPPWLKPCLGGLMLGLSALVIPQVLGPGYGWVQGVIDGADWIPEGNAGYLLLFAVAAAKMIAVGLTIGSGATGGEMGPSMVIGGLVGGGFGLLFHSLWPELVPQPSAFALVGMGAFFGGVANVPVSSLIMVCEMASSYDLLAPLMLSEAVTFVVLRRTSVYRSQLRGRVESPAHRDELTVDILESLLVRDVFAADTRLERVGLSTPLGRIMQVMSQTALPAVLVEDDERRVVGIVSIETIQAALGQEGLEEVAVAADLLAPARELATDDHLHTALHAFLASGASVLPVVEHDGDSKEIVGVLTHADVDRAYDRACATVGAASDTAS